MVSEIAYLAFLVLVKEFFCCPSLSGILPYTQTWFLTAGIYFTSSMLKFIVFFHKEIYKWKSFHFYFSLMLYQNVILINYWQ